MASGWLLILGSSIAGVGVGVLAWRNASRRTRALLSRTGTELERLRRSEEARIRFFANIVHELRTPLTLVLGRIDAALVEDSDVERAHQLRVASRNARRIQRLADQALELTRLDAGAAGPRPRPLELVPFMESLVMSFEELAERKGVLLEFLARPRSIRARLDSDQLTTMVGNLLSNAFKHTPAGGRVGVALEAIVRDDRPAARTNLESAASSELRITVVDTGPGIRPEIRPHLFERFARGPDEDRANPSGAGIGLALTRELARSSGGDVELDPDTTVGARFVLTLPLEEDARPVPPESLPATPAPTVGERPQVTEEILHRTTAGRTADDLAAAERTGDRPSILAVDDSPDLRDWLAAELEPLGSVITAADGQSALELARDSVPDVVLADVRMADMNGIELCRRLRADERTSHLTIVMLSVESTVDRRVAALEAGADDYVPKPVDARELRARIEGLLLRSRALRERFRGQVILHPSEIDVPSAEREFLERIVQTVEAEIGNDGFSVPELADAMALSRSQLTRKLQSLIGQSPGQLIRSIRLQRAADLIAGNAASIGRIAHSVGFSDQAHFTRTFKRYFGKTPSEFRRDAASDAAAHGPS